MVAGTPAAPEASLRGPLAVRLLLALGQQLGDPLAVRPADAHVLLGEQVQNTDQGRAELRASGGWESAS
jgi:hypothetical protein